MSDAVVTSDDWHRVAFTWDGANRRLCLDGTLVAEDCLGELADTGGKLMIGSSKNCLPGRFWVGAIDEVRIYNRALKP